jgi:hypothetical protein
VGNGGDSAAGPGATVRFYDGDPTVGTLLGTAATTQSLAPGAFEDVSFTFAGNASSQATLWVVVTATGDCVAANNQLDSGLQLNRAPQANAGPDQFVDVAASVATLVGTADDDGLPTGSTVAVNWTQISGPPATIDSPNSLTTVVHFTGLGEYELKLDATDGSRSSSDTVKVTVHPTNRAPTVTAQGTQTITDPPTSSVTLTATANDDGLPTGALTYQWSLAQGPGTVVFGSPTALTTTAAFRARSRALRPRSWSPSFAETGRPS